MKRIISIGVFFFALIVFLTRGINAQVPALVNYQGRVAVDGINFQGAGQFKFALVNADGTETFWSNDGTSVNGSEPDNAVALAVAKGLYSVLLGDSAVPNMSALPTSVFANSDVRLRVWFDDGANGSQLLTPDQRIAPAAYLADGAVTTASIADSAVTTEKIATGAVIGSTIAAGSIEGANIAPASLDFSHLTVPAAPEAGQVLGFDGATLNWTAPGAGDGVWTLDGTLAYRLGDVAIGTATPNPAYRLTVAGAAQFVTGGAGGTLQIGTANSETGMTIAGPMGRADLRFNGTSLKLVASPAGFIPPAANGVAITTGGLVGIGRDDPQAKLHVFNPADSVTHLIESQGGTNSWAQVRFANPSGQWSIGTSREFNGNQFYISRVGSAQIAFGLQPNGDASLQGTLSCKVLTIRGGADLAEPFAMSHSGIAPGAVVVIDPENPGKLKQSAKAYDKRVAGIVSGANGIEPGISMIDEELLEAGENVALSGRVYVRADASGGAIKPGDMLTTSDISGCAMKANDPGRAQGAVMGKAMSALSEGQGMVLVLVTLQ